MFDAEHPASPSRRFKAVCELPQPPAAVLATLSNNARRQTWDRNISSLDALLLQAAPVRAVLLRSATKGMYGISSRDFLDVSVELHFDAPPPPPPPLGARGCFAPPAGSIAVGGVGVEGDARFPAGLGGAVRGFNSPGSGWVFEALPGGGTRVHYLIHVELRGWLPSALVNAGIARSYVDFFEDLIGALSA